MVKSPNRGHHPHGPGIAETDEDPKLSVIGTIGGMVQAYRNGLVNLDEMEPYLKRSSPVTIFGLHPA
jgi:hypothetical protein